MKLLLDTHAFIWWATEPKKIRPQTMALCRNTDNIILLSAASVWEMYIKFQVGKLTFHEPLPDLIAKQQATNQLRILPVELAHVYALEQLPMHHKDPFDRLLIAQAFVENAVVISHDTAFAQYPVNVQW